MASVEHNREAITRSDVSEADRDTAFCIEALEEALAKFDRPEIFNTDQGSQFTSTEFTDVLQAARVRISMDGRGRWMDNVFIERLWLSLAARIRAYLARTLNRGLRAGDRGDVAVGVMGSRH